MKRSAGVQVLWYGTLVRNGLGLGIEQQGGYPGVDESFSAETLRLEVLLLRIENYTRYGLSLGEGHSKNRSVQIDSDKQ